MAVRVVVHVVNEEPFLADMEELPTDNATHLQLKNPKTREGKAVTWLARGVVSLLYPWSRISFIEVLADGGEPIEKFYRESPHL